MSNNQGGITHCSQCEQFIGAADPDELVIVQFEQYPELHVWHRWHFDAFYLPEGMAAEQYPNGIWHLYTLPGA